MDINILNATDLLHFVFAQAEISIIPAARRSRTLLRRTLRGPCWYGWRRAVLPHWEEPLQRGGHNPMVPPPQPETKLLELGRAVSTGRAGEPGGTSGGTSGGQGGMEGDTWATEGGGFKLLTGGGKGDGLTSGALPAVWFHVWGKMMKAWGCNFTSRLSSCTAHENLE